jgi:hypothetical protein
MKTHLISIICLSLCMTCIQAVQCYQNVGEDFGISWLQQHATKPVSVLEAHNNLWNWGSTPKGYTIYNNTLYPPGYGPKWFYPAILTSAAPVVVNSTEANNYLSQSLLPDAPYTDPWLLAQLLGRPVSYVNVPSGPLF